MYEADHGDTAVVEALEAIYSDREEARALGVRASEYIQEHFTWRHYMDQFIPLVEEALAKNS